MVGLDKDTPTYGLRGRFGVGLEKRLYGRSAHQLLNVGHDDRDLQQWQGPGSPGRGTGEDRVIRLDFRRFVAMCSLGVVLLSGCAAHPAPPPLNEAELLNVFAMETLGETAPAANAVRLLTAMPDFCIDLHRPERSIFSEEARDVGQLDKILMRLGLRGGFTAWHGAGSLSARPIDPAMASRLSGATARLTLEFVRRPAPAVADKPWPERCRQRNWLTAPIYQNEFAFVESGWTCGGLCGAGHLIALEYRGGRWRVVGIHDTWNG